MRHVHSGWQGALLHLIPSQGSAGGDHITLSVTAADAGAKEGQGVEHQQLKALACKPHMSIPLMFHWPKKSFGSIWLERDKTGPSSHELSWSREPKILLSRVGVHQSWSRVAVGGAIWTLSHRLFFINYGVRDYYGIFEDRNAATNRINTSTNF